MPVVWSVCAIGYFASSVFWGNPAASASVEDECVVTGFCSL